MTLSAAPILHPARIRRSVVAILVGTVIVTTAVAYWAAYRYVEGQQRRAAENQLVLYQRSLNDALQRHQHLPYVLAQDRLFHETPTAQTIAAQNARLKDFAHKANLEAIYLMTLGGVVQAASNAGEAHSFIGQNYGFRPYFQTAAAGQRSDYFAIGATSGRPGYFVAEPVRDVMGQVVGVLAIKLDISELQAAWEAQGEAVLAVNRDGIVVISADPTRLYHTLSDLDPERLAQIAASRQFGDTALTPLEWVASPGRVSLQRYKYILASGPADWRGWTVHFLAPEAAIARQTLVATALLGTVIAALIGFATYLRSFRIAAALEASQAHRHALLAANTQLTEAQAELARTSKLAALGHLAASVTHELGQPISALKTHLTAAEIGNEITSPETAASLWRLTERMDAITGQLRFFARGQAAPKAPVDLRQVLREAVDLLRHDVEAGGITLDLPEGGAVRVLGQQLALEQALGNLLRNAVHAVAGAAAPKIAITLTQTATHAEITVADTGPGLGEMSLSELQEPFFSTKPSGVGMGLGLAITADIVAAHDGTLAAQSTPEGAVFTLTLPRDGIAS